MAGRNRASAPEEKVGAPSLSAAFGDRVGFAARYHCLPMPSLVAVRRCAIAVLSLSALLIVGCKHPGPLLDHPRLAPGMRMVDVNFHSAALNREMPYRVFLPASVAPGAKYPVVYLLHGGGGGFRDWSNDSDVVQYATQGLILVMPEGGSSYYVNSATKPNDRYEDYIVEDLIPDAEHRFPVAGTRSGRAIVGVSMGGYGAIRIAFDHPDLFAFVGAVSAALDVPSRPFSIHRVGQWRRFRALFGPIGSPTERAGDPFLFAQTTDPACMPYLWLAAGEQEALLGPNRRFANDLKKRGFQLEFHTAPGAHDWQQWNEQIPGLFVGLQQRLAIGSLVQPH
jgi:putative tributyrin esterase